MVHYGWTDERAFMAGGQVAVVGRGTHLIMTAVAATDKPATNTLHRVRPGRPAGRLALQDRQQRCDDHSKTQR